MVWIVNVAQLAPGSELIICTNNLAPNPTNVAAIVRKCRFGSLVFWGSAALPCWLSMVGARPRHIVGLIFTKSGFHQRQQRAHLGEVGSLHISLWLSFRVQWKEYWHGELPGEYLTQVLWSQRNKLWWYFRVESWGIPEITGRNWEPKKCHKSMVCSKKWPQRLGPPALNFTRTLMQFHLGSFGFVKETTPKFTENWCFIWLYNVVYIYIYICI